MQSTTSTTAAATAADRQCAFLVFFQIRALARRDASLFFFRSEISPRRQRYLSLCAKKISTLHRQGRKKKRGQTKRGQGDPPRHRRLGRLDIDMNLDLNLDTEKTNQTNKTPPPHRLDRLSVRRPREASQGKHKRLHFRLSRQTHQSRRAALHVCDLALHLSVLAGCSRASRHEGCDGGRRGSRRRVQEALFRTIDPGRESLLRRDLVRFFIFGFLFLFLF